MPDPSRSPRPPSPSHRTFRIVYGFLVLNFFFPAWTYLLAPRFAIGQFEDIGRALGGGAYALAALETGFVWRVLAAGNVLTLSFMCALLWWDLRRWYPVLVPLVSLKAFSSLAYLGVYVFGHRYPAFLAVFAYDGVTVWAMIWFAVRARRELARIDVGAPA